MTEGFSTKEIVQQQHEILKEMNAKLDEVVIQTTKTNGRMTAAEEIIKIHGNKISDLQKKVAIATGIIIVLIFIVEKIPLFMNFLP